MDTTSYLALSRQVVLHRHMATLANNLANATTTGYRAEHTLFDQVLDRGAGNNAAAFVRDVALIRDLTPGAVVPTGNPLDLAIDGPGYLTFATPDGPSYARGGHLAVDASGQIVDSAGHALLDDGGSPIILLADDRQISIAADGTVSGRSGPLARIVVATFANEQAMERVGDGLYRTAEPPLPAGGGRIVQGALEGSNVRPVLELTTMLETVRAFEGAQRLLDTQHELDRATNDRVIRVGS
jgi:flagellar basal-body rod protein FlgF